jgi:hypothetical protein
MQSMMGRLLELYNTNLHWTHRHRTSVKVALERRPLGKRVDPSQE